MDTTQYDPFQWRDFLLHKRFFMPRETLVSQEKRYLLSGVVLLRNYD